MSAERRIESLAVESDKPLSWTTTYSGAAAASMAVQATLDSAFLERSLCCCDSQCACPKEPFTLIGAKRLESAISDKYLECESNLLTEATRTLCSNLMKYHKDSAKQTPGKP